ncbi:MAG TPA: HD domain-containing protein [Spirochaetota bacterium]|nr:HD domain-containing protein [Spirochaetota bacterium]HPU87592.1 HD domain-containing protein [Spirochaetota bacterium]
MSEQATIDLARFQELKLSFFTKLSGEKVLTFDIIDQSGAVVFEAGIAIDQNEVVAKSQQGCRFFMPKVVESYGHEIVSRPAIQKLADETREIYSSVRATGAMSYEQFLQSNAHLHSIIDGLRQEDRLGGCLGLLRDMEDFDYYTYAHSANLGVLAMVLAYKLGYDKTRMRNMALAGYLHDIGKLGVQREVLSKAGRLTSDEYNQLVEHTRMGYRILDNITGPGGQKMVSDVIKGTAIFHHRKYKNMGYPFRPARERNSETFYRALPEEIRMIAICDVYDAITTSTPYRTAEEPRTGLRKILNLSNHYFILDDVLSFIKTLACTLNKGKGVLDRGDFIVLESVRSSRDNPNQKEPLYEFARIMSTNSGRPIEPNVHIFFNASDNKKIRSIEVDMRHDYTRKIVRVITNERLTERLRRHALSA